MTLSNANGFGFRSIWVAQALRAVQQDHTIFSKENVQKAMDMFGLGNKKVEALQFWIRAAGLATLTTSGEMALTPLGLVISRSDPDLIAEGTWWFVHTQLCRRKTEPGLRDSTTWHWYTFDFRAAQFDKSLLRDSLSMAYPSAASRTIASATNELVNSMQGSPLGEMGLMRPLGDMYYRQAPLPLNLHPAVLGYGILTWANDRRRGGKTANLSELCDRGPTVANIYGFSEAKLVTCLERLSDHYGHGSFAFHRTAGLNSLALFLTDPMAMAKAYYLETIDGLGAGEALEVSTRG